jgi:hypothetical protein
MYVYCNNFIAFTRIWSLNFASGTYDFRFVWVAGDSAGNHSKIVWEFATCSLPHAEKCSLLLPDFNQNWNVLTNSRKTLHCQFHENLFSRALLMEAASTSETLVTYRTAWCIKPEDSHLQIFWNFQFYEVLFHMFSL